MNNDFPGSLPNPPDPLKPAPEATPEPVLEEPVLEEPAPKVAVKPAVKHKTVVKHAVHHPPVVHKRKPGKAKKR